MQKLSNFVEFINEAGRGRPRKNPDYEVTTEKIDGIEIQSIPSDALNDLSDKERKKLEKKVKLAERAKGKSEDKNGTNGEWAIDPPYEDPTDLGIKNMDPALKNKNSLAIIKRIKEKKPFFIQGKAGWGKTSVITDIAKRLNKHIITVYLDKAQATDLGGIPVPIQTKNGTAKIVNAMPDWAAYMLENEDKQFLLFFDEMNQAAPDVMNALMPIVLRNVICNIQFKNFIVGAAGNFIEENENGITDLSGPLASRFGNKPIIWETGTEEAWNSAFAHLKKKHGNEISKILLDAVIERKHLFNNPREIENFIIESCIEAKKDEEKEEWVNIESIYDDLARLAKDDLSRNEEKELQQLAQYSYNFIMDIEKKEEDNTRSGRGRDMITDTDREGILQGITRGYMNPLEDGKAVKYGISQENIIAVMTDPDIFPESKINAEMAQRLLDKWTEDGVKFKFKTDKEWKDRGYLDPLA